MAFISARIEAIDQRTQDVRLLTLAPSQNLGHHAGQYVLVQSGEFDPRPFSIANAPQKDGRIILHVRDRSTPLSKHLFTLNAGDTLHIEGPLGNMMADVCIGRPILMVAGGTGIAPMLALAGDILRRGLTEEGITIVYGARSEDDVYCRRELDALMASGEISLCLATGPDTPDMALRELSMSLANHVIYISGPDKMMAPVQNILLVHLAQETRIYKDTIPL